MNTAGEEDSNLSVCANCGKEDNNNLKSCTACKSVKYCNRECQISHRSQHKKECKKRAAELHDIELFKQPPNPYGDCPICFQQLPTLHTGWKYMSCCGKEICSGCTYAPVYDNQGNEVVERKCPFCRTPNPASFEEALERLIQLVEKDDPIAIHNLGCYYRDGINGYPQDYTKALELWHQAGELGYSEAYHCIGYTYDIGRGVEVDRKKLCIIMKYQL